MVCLLVRAEAKEPRRSSLGTVSFGMGLRAVMPRSVKVPIPLRDHDGWHKRPNVEDVMDQPSFVQLRTHIWRGLRDEQAASD